MKQLTEKQIDLITMYAKKAGLKPQMVIDWIEGGKLTISELSQGILGQPVAIGSV